MTQGCAAQPRSPASQNIMPRSWPLSASTSTSVTSAPQALATTTPVSRTRTVAPPRASASTRNVAAIAPTAAEHCTAQSDAPSSSANKAPTDEPPETPSTYESASGLRNSACSSTPASASSAPMVNAESSRGARNSSTTVRAGSAGSPNKRGDGRAHADVGGTRDQAEAGDDGRERERAKAVTQWWVGAKSRGIVR